MPTPFLLAGFLAATLLASADPNEPLTPPAPAPIAASSRATPALPGPGVLADKFSPSDTLTNRLLATQADLSNALAALKLAPTAPHGGSVERAIADVNRALAEVGNGFAYVSAHPASDPISAWEAENSAAGAMPKPLPPIPTWVGRNYGGARGVTTLRNSGQGADQNLVDALDALTASYREFNNFAPEIKPYEVSDIGGSRDAIREDIRRAVSDIVAGLDFARNNASPRPTLPNGELVINGGFETLQPRAARAINGVTGTLVAITDGNEPAGFGWRIHTGSSFQHGSLYVIQSGYTRTLNTGETVAFTAPAAEGKNWLDLSSPDVGLLTQVLPTKPGETYVLTFAYANSPYPPSAGTMGGTSVPAHPFEAIVSVKDTITDADLIKPVTFSHATSTIADYHWDRHAPIKFTAIGAHVTLQFAPNYNSRLYDGIFLDDVSVQPVTATAAPAASAAATTTTK